MVVAINDFIVFLFSFGDADADILQTEDDDVFFGVKFVVEY